MTTMFMLAPVPAGGAGHRGRTTGMIVAGETIEVYRDPVPAVRVSSCVGTGHLEGLPAAASHPADASRRRVARRRRARPGPASRDRVSSGKNQRLANFAAAGTGTASTSR
jgi:hypothetical protein